MLMLLIQMMILIIMTSIIRLVSGRSVYVDIDSVADEDDDNAQVSVGLHRPDDPSGRCGHWQWLL